MASLNEFASLDELLLMVDVPAQQDLHALPRRPVDQRLMLAGIPLALVENFADVRSVLQDGVNHASREFRLRGAEHQPFGVEAFDQAIERHVLKSVEVEDAFD